MRWLGIKTQLQLFHFEETGRGLRTQKKIEKGDVLISIPLDKMITRQKIAMKYPKDWSTQLMLSCFLMEEKCSKKSNIYLDTLPQTYSVPYFDCPPFLIEFLPIYLQNPVLKQFGLVQREFEKLPAGKDFSKDLFAWAWFTVNTRGVFYRDNHDNIALAPFLDMFNHSCHVQVEAVLNGNFYQLKSCASTLKKSQVFINYGPHDNVKLYLEYGFVVPENPHDCVSLSLTDFNIQGAQ